jgi:hypothetical protein
MVRSAWIGAVAVVVGLAATPASAGAAAQAASPSVHSDFNGDGAADLAISIPGDTVGSDQDAGSVLVLYGPPPGTTFTQSWSAATPGIKGLAGIGNEFGSSLAGGDFNGDGFDDLALGTESERAAGISEAGTVRIIYGSASGLTAAGNQLFTQNSPGVPGQIEHSGRFGSTVVAGNFGRGPQSDLAVFAPGQTIAGVTDAGAVTVLYGTSSGLSGSGSQLWSQATPGIRGTPESEDFFGQAMVAANFGKGSTGDLVIAAPDDRVGSAGGAGSVTVIYGTPTGLSSTGSQFLNEDAIGTPVGQLDQFGSALAAGSFGRGTPIDLAVGAPGAEVTGVAGAGAVSVMYGTTAGLSVDGADRLTQSGTGTGTTEADDGFGAALAAGNFGMTAQSDLAVGVPAEDLGSTQDAGSVSVIYGTTAGLTATGSQLLTQQSIGLGAIEAFDNFGQVLFALDLGNGPQKDLMIGDPREDIGSVQDSGAVFAVFGSSTGLTSSGDLSWSEDTAGVPGDVGPSNRLGQGLA